jgi:hypothetical protein
MDKAIGDLHGIMALSVMASSGRLIMGTAIAGIIFALIRSYLWNKDREGSRDSSVGYQMSLLDRKEALETKERLIRIGDIINSDSKV